MDGIPTVFMEAMASGRPVISCPISGIPELVRDGETGLLVSPDDPTALAAAVIKLANDDALRSQLGRQARALVTIQHDQHRNARRLTEILTAAPRSVSGP
jgi:glycosyltransferase involved in cell wall biosynthesis